MDLHPLGSSHAVQFSACNLVTYDLSTGGFCANPANFWFKTADLHEMISQPNQDPIAHLESSVRGYARLFPATFESALGSHLFDANGRRFIDFFCGAGTLNYGHNNQRAKEALLDYISRDGIQHSLDTVTTAKVEFMNTLCNSILQPRGLEYKVQFTGPTGTNAVEAAIKLARKQKQRSHIVAFTHAYHGHSLGALALTANEYYHSEHYGSHNNISHMPFDGYLGDQDTSVQLERMIEDPSSGLPLPAAIILETVQGEGGVNVASDQWLQNVQRICRQHDILLIIDDIQVGNGRTGKFFSFEHAGVEPDMVCLSKSIGGGLPLSLVLIRPNCDAWEPGQHTGTFRGNNLAFVAANAVLSHWNDPEFERQISFRGKLVHERLKAIREKHADQNFDIRGRGMIWGLDVRSGSVAKNVIRRCFDSGLLIESSGAYDEVLKVMPALTIDIETLEQGIKILDAAIDEVMRGNVSKAAAKSQASAPPVTPAQVMPTQLGPNAGADLQNLPPTNA